MLKPVKQVGAKAEPVSEPALDAPARVSEAATQLPQTLQISSDDWDDPQQNSTHEIQGSLAPVTSSPKVPAKKINPIKRKQLETRVNDLETELGDLEARILAAEQQQVVFTTAEAARSLAAELDALRDRRATATEEWEKLALELEEQTV